MKQIIIFTILANFIGFYSFAQNPNVKIITSKEQSIYQQSKPNIKMYAKVEDKDTLIYITFDDIRYSSSIGVDALTKTQCLTMVDAFYEMIDPKYEPNGAIMELKPGVFLAKVKVGDKISYWYKSMNRMGGIAELNEKQVKEIRSSLYRYLGTSLN